MPRTASVLAAILLGIASLPFSTAISAAAGTDITCTPPSSASLTYDPPLKDLLIDAVTNTKEETLAAIDSLSATISQDTAILVRSLIEEVLDQPYLDLDAVALLADSARQLRHFAR